MITRLVFEDGPERLELEFPDGLLAHEFILRLTGTRSNRHAYRSFSRREIAERQTRDYTLDQVIEILNRGDDELARQLRDRAKIKRQRVVVHDPGSVAGSYWEDP